jgi:mevalonate kinase
MPWYRQISAANRSAEELHIAKVANPVATPREIIGADQGVSAALQLFFHVESVQAACNVFWHHCKDHSISLPTTGFTLSYDTNIPRQCGLSGSSAIVIATLNCLVDLHGLRERSPLSPPPPPMLEIPDPVHPV